ncbi:uncharacterized protein BKA55DRAFT_363559 [Fusarium redolens]|uniref:Uncharacterized protein n=1 Tax=Fusarium redolens TaxID=48865 RepID=A0A9P9H3J7_FUSRE|nr:uncharacterized protein BKA55DRAFT_363559 [Fusarium redolens]KAH7249842.1 hypothetical protein BKA55DRAFT_363559 [Fusarium redolens]
MSRESKVRRYLTQSKGGITGAHHVFFLCLTSFHFLQVTDAVGEDCSVMYSVYNACRSQCKIRKSLPIWSIAMTRSAANPR